jgi:aryl-alcohol dehydrogenase-like predicted oxidoreductase
MDYRFLGRTGLKVSEFCLGTMTFSGDTDVETSLQMLDHLSGAWLGSCDPPGRDVGHIE